MEKQKQGRWWVGIPAERVLGEERDVPSVSCVGSDPGGAEGSLLPCESPEAQEQPQPALALSTHPGPCSPRPGSGGRYV